ncbi:PhzF family phenazine biosynthesis protein [Sphingomonas sp. TDK1]|uniref:PhzF family phenazine biosynthesis protein n=1 Tax=Sphingomonas sp. TDK1 TaxID=453247 RepID=UPI0007DA33C3|nr:PhzF family phenazine biosynthesis protein [Sphingomonas sp. TDK1]OAN61571.1 isomerase [Sphingomonas sp. TDK1]
MEARLFQLASFTAARFAGNPAAVMLFDSDPATALCQALAAENNLAETAFLVPQGEDFRIRWFTPAVEVPLCGHATLASAAVVLERLTPWRTQVVFHSASGPLTVRRSDIGYVMDFPVRRCAPGAAPEGLADALGATPEEVEWDGFNFVARLASADEVRRLDPDIAAIARLPAAGVIVTAAGDGDYDCVSRYFAPARGIPEDPVTGGAHCALTPFWAERLGKTALHAFQASPRGGEMWCRLRGDRVDLEGACLFYLEGVARW